MLDTDKLEQKLDDSKEFMAHKQAQSGFNVQAIFDRYTENPKLKKADIFHLYDTGEECIKDDSGMHDSRHFMCIAFNSLTQEKVDLGKHDGIDTLENEGSPLKLARVYADGSFLIRFMKPVHILRGQLLLLCDPDDRNTDKDVAAHNSPKQ